MRPSAKVLIIKFGAIGDAIMTLPAARAIHEAGYGVDWVCGSNIAPLLSAYPWINAIVADERSMLKGTTWQKLKALSCLWRTIGGRRYRLCATLYYDKRYKLVSAPVWAEKRLMLSLADRDSLLIPGRSHADEYCRVVLNRLTGQPEGDKAGCAAPVHPENLPASPLARRGNSRRIVLVPGGARNMLRDNPLRRWPTGNYVTLANSLLLAGLEVILVGGADDRWVVPAFGSLEVTDLIGSLSLPQTLSLLNDSDVVVTHDTGPLHLAGVTTAGIVAIFGPTSPYTFLPRRTGSIALWGGKDFACRPCYDGKDFAPCTNNACVQQVQPQDVTDAVLKMLEERARGEFCARRVTEF